VKLLVTGGNGFIGSAVVRRLVESGHRVVCLLRERSDVARIADVPYVRAHGDIRDAASVRAAMTDCDATIHLAAPGGWEADDLQLLDQVIVEGARHVFEIAASLAHHRVVLVSSTAAIAASETPVVFDERTPFTVPADSLAYAHAKHRAERVAGDSVESGADVVIVNPAEVYGPGDTALLTAGNLIDFATSTPVLVCRGGTGVVHVDDVAAGIVAALEHGRTGERYILSGENLTIRQLAELVIRFLGRRVPIISAPNGPVRAFSRLAARLKIPVPYNPHVVPYATRFWFVDAAKARRELGASFRPAVDTIESTLDWLVESGRLRASRRIHVCDRPKIEYPM
jgi:dihydroflavonol-4-reductase